jgi:hypothetical protein
MPRMATLTLALVLAATSVEANSGRAENDAERIMVLYLFENSAGKIALADDPSGNKLRIDLPRDGWNRALDQERRPIAPVRFVESDDPWAGILGFAPTPAEDILRSIRERGYFFDPSRASL